jgi:hypothetical protein
MSHLSEPTIDGYRAECSYKVDATGTKADGGRYGLPPITFMFRAGPTYVQDYFTPDEARTLAQALIDCADEVESEDVFSVADELGVQA